MYLSKYSLTIFSLPHPPFSLPYLASHVTCRKRARSLVRLLHLSTSAISALLSEEPLCCAAILSAAKSSLVTGRRVLFARPRLHWSSFRARALCESDYREAFCAVLLQCCR